ncbi:MAG: DHH family phosphoesterase [Candidatus Bathyarchaeota archaeon]|nr:DHH family phosphoesterase [Candidatus Bathyarchaeota archaeon]
MNLEDFNRKVGKAILELKQTKPLEIILVHHDDADGLCSGAIMKTALEREGYKVKTFCLEKVYPEVIESLHKGTGQTIFYVDIGSAHADFISECNSSRNLTIILDHHDPKPPTDPKVHDLNLEYYGFRGETDFSGATCNYLFAKALNEHNVDLSYLALVGSKEIPGNLTGLNKVVLDEAIKNGVVQVKDNKIKIVKLGLRVNQLFSKLQILGAVGYYSGGPQFGIQAALEGLTEQIKKKIDDWEEQRKTVNKRLVARLYRERLKETEHIQWFDAGNMYKGMGTKVIGQFCSFLSYRTRLIKPDKYIFGFVNVPQEIPNWGKLKQLLVKVSVRVPKNLKSMIEEDKMPGAVNLLLKASEGFGVADGHQYAASVVIPLDKKEDVIDNAEKSWLYKQKHKN